MNVQIARVRILGLNRESWLQRRPTEESDLDVLCDAVEGYEPALALNAIERRIPPYSFAHVGNRTGNQRIKVPTDVTFPSRHGSNVGLHRGIAVTLGDLWVAAGEELGLLGQRGGRILFRVVRRAG